MWVRGRRAESEVVDRSKLRLAVISTPRVGNMWLRRQLVALYGLEERSAHTPDEVDWESLPEACVLQLHWSCTREFERTLRRHGFQVLVLTRHPLDTLISILQFARHEPETARWLDGAKGDERSILEADPTSAAFRAYATSPRAQALLNLSGQWWERALVSIRYEELVAAPSVELQRVIDALGVTPALAPEEVGREITFGRLQAEAANRHFWQGKPQQWRELLPQAVANEIARPYAKLLRRFGYDVQADPELTAEEAAVRWHAKIGTHRAAALDPQASAA